MIAPSFIDPELGPAYSSRLLQGFKLITRIIAVALLVFSITIFFVTRQYRSICYLYRHQMIPWFEALLLFVATVMSSTAEGHGFFQITSLTAGKLQTLEEMFELCFYLSLLLAQIVVFDRLCKSGK